MNTKISFMYRDADNYKFFYSSIVNGEISKEQIETIISCLDEGEYFIPELVGLPCDYVSGYDFDEQSDHAFCELNEDSFEPIVAKATVNMTACELVAAFQKASGHWNAPEGESYIWSHTDHGTVLAQRGPDGAHAHHIAEFKGKQRQND